jgi:pimeloyl-ACP methyl ester carboxylesterase
MSFEIQEEGRFSFVEKGEGPVLLLLHGLFGALSNWAPVLDFFSSDYKVVIPLLPVYNMPLRKTSVGGLSDYVHAFVEARGYEQFTLLGNSLGGHVALVYVLEHQERVRSVVLTGSSGLYENSMGGTVPKRGDYQYIKQKVEYTFYSPQTATKELVDEVYEIVNDRSKAFRIITMAKSAIRHNLRKEIAHIQAPVCLIWGKDDKITPPEAALEFHERLPKSEIHWIDACGHAPMMEQPAAFNQELAAFLSRVYQYESR